MIQQLENLNYLDTWEQEKDRIFRLFQTEEYGVRSPLCSRPLTYKKVREKMDGNLYVQQVVMMYDDFEMPIYIYLPITQGIRHKTFVLGGLSVWRKTFDYYSDYDSFHFCPVREIIKQGFAIVLVDFEAIASDSIGGENTGIFKAMNIKRTPDSFGVLSAWAYGLSKAVDFLETQPQFDLKNLSVIGHSRGGKTALLAGVYDSRFKLVIANDSGCAGASISRNKKGERIKDIVERFPYWFCENFSNYKNKEDELPFDQHLLLALLAPRYVYVASALEDGWADPNNELLATKLASPYFTKYGVEGLIAPEKISLNTPYIDGHLCYHIRDGKHALTPVDWEFYCQKFVAI